MTDRNDYIDLIKAYLDASAARRIDEARSYLAADAELVFPDGRFSSPEELVASAGRRYRWVKKVYQSWDVSQHDDGSVTVYSVGTLYGENLHGVAFKGVRYIDRFVVRNGKIISQQVWNDLAESGVLERRRKPDD